MASNLVSDALKMATPAVVDRLAAALGVGSDVVRTILANAVPGLFAGIARQAGTSTGLGNILAGVQQVDPDLPAKLLSTLDGGAQSPLVAGGTAMLRQVAGDDALDAIVNAVSKTSGVSPAASGALVAVAGQMAIAALGKQAAGLDADGLLALLGSQMKSFQSALPASLASAPGFSVGGSGASAARSSHAPATVRDTAQAAASAHRELADDGGGSGWLMWLVPVIVIAATLWYYLGQKQAAMVTEPKPASTAQPANTPPSLAVGSVDVGKLLSASIAELTDALKGVTDAASAQTAIIKLKAITPDIAQVVGLAAKFTPDQRKTLAALVAVELPQLKDLAAKVEAQPGAGDIVKPVIDPAIAQLEALAKG